MLVICRQSRISPLVAGDPVGTLDVRCWPDLPNSDGTPSPDTRQSLDQVVREAARLAISAKDRNAALTAAEFGNRPATSGAMTTFELARSRSMYFPRTNVPKSERLYSGRSSSLAIVLAFLIEFPLS